MKGYSSLIIKKTLHYLQENGYINDKEFVRLFVASKQEKGWGQTKVRLGLKRLGVSEDLIDEATKDKNLFTADDPFIYRKYLNTVDPNGPYYTCQFCGTIHKGYYTNSGLSIDFRSLNKV